MTRVVIEETFDHVINTATERLQSLGFTRRGRVLRIMGKDTCGIVEFQRSMKSTRDRLLFTVNLGVACGNLLNTGPSALRKARVIDAHVRERIGMLLPDHPDKWWEITPSTSPDELAHEVSDLIVKEAVPYIQRYLSADSIILLWESGQSPGLTERQRLDRLAALKAKRQGRAV